MIGITVSSIIHNTKDWENSKMLKVSERFYGLCRHFCCKCVVNRMFLFDKMIQYSPLRELISEGIFIRWF